MDGPSAARMLAVEARGMGKPPGPPAFSRTTPAVSWEPLKATAVPAVAIAAWGMRAYWLMLASSALRPHIELLSATMPRGWGTMIRGKSSLPKKSRAAAAIKSANAAAMCMRFLRLRGYMRNVTDESSAQWLYALAGRDVDSG